jgi:hypothetical protein
MLPPRLSAVTIGARDMRVLRRFYQDLGWHELPGGSDEWSAFVLGGVVLALYPLSALAAEAEAEPSLSGWSGVTMGSMSTRRTSLCLAVPPDCKVGHAWCEGLPGAASLHTRGGAMSFISEDEFAAAAAQDNPSMQRLAEALAQGEVSRSDNFSTLKNSTNPEVRALGNRIVRYYLENGIGVVDWNVSRYAEDRIADGDLGVDVLYVVQQVIDAPAESGRYALAYTLTNFNGPGDPKWRLDLLHKFADATTDSESAHVLLKRILAERPQETFEWLQPVLARLESTEADRILIREAFENKTFADVLADWLTNREFSAPGDCTRQFQARIESGENPATAAEAVVHQCLEEGND